MLNKQALIDRFGTPLFVYRLENVVAAHGDLISALPQSSTLFYSLKANPHPDLVRALRECGCFAEVSSVGELRVALDAEIGGNQCLYTGPGKTDQELSLAIGKGVRLFSAESEEEIKRLQRAARPYGVTIGCLLRIDSGRAVGSSGLRMTGISSQFGISASAIVENPQAFQSRENLEVVGLHFFSASNVRDEESLFQGFRANVDVAVRLRREAGIQLRWLDLGGGFATPYARPGERPRYHALRPRLEAVLDAHLPDWRQGTPRIAFEAGRYLVGSSGILIARIVDSKRSDNRQFVILDTGIHHLGGLSGLGRLLPLQAQPFCEPSESVIEVDLVGPLCTPADVLGRDVKLQDSLPGDVVTIPNVGAYGLTASLLAFLSRAAPVEVVLDRDKLFSATRVELQRQTVQE